MKRTATIRKWYNSKGWGIAQSFADKTNPPVKFFVHVNNRISQDAILDLDVKIAFVEGAPRHPGELPVALEIEVVPLPPVMAKVVKPAEVKPVVVKSSSSSEVKS